MNKAAILLKYSGALIVFLISYGICSTITHFLIQLQNKAIQGFLIEILASCMAGVLSVYVGLAVVGGIFSSLKPRTVAWVFISFMGLIWGIVILGMVFGLVLGVSSSEVLLDLGEIIDANADLLPMAVQAIAAGITAWKLTLSEGKFGTR